jgi:hypothetical protein
MSIHPSFTFKVLSSLAVTAGLVGVGGCSPTEKPAASLFWDVPPASASTDAVLVAGVVYIGDLFAEAEQRLKNGSDRPELAATF